MFINQPPSDDHFKTMLAPARSKRPRSLSPPSSPSIHSPLELLIKRRRNERPPLERELSREGEDEWAGVERRRNRMWERAQEPGPSRLAASETEESTEQAQQANHWETPNPTRAYHSQHHHQHHQYQPSSSPIRPPDNVPTYSPFGDNQPPDTTAANVSYREPRGYFDIRTPGSPVASPTPFPATWDSPYAGSNALLHQLHLARLAGPQATPLSLSPLILSPQPQTMPMRTEDDMDMDQDDDDGGRYENTNRMLGELDRIRQQRWADERVGQ